MKSLNPGMPGRPVCGRAFGTGRDARIPSDASFESSFGRARLPVRRRDYGVLGCGLFLFKHLAEGLRTISGQPKITGSGAEDARRAMVREGYACQKVGGVCLVRRRTCTAVKENEPSVVVVSQSSRHVDGCPRVGNEKSVNALPRVMVDHVADQHRVAAGNERHYTLHVELPSGGPG